MTINISLFILELYIFVVLNSYTVFPILSNSTLNCSISVIGTQIFNYPIQLQNNDINGYLKIQGVLNSNPGIIVMKVFPFYERMPLNRPEILLSLSNDYKTFYSSSSNGYVDLQAIFQYKQTQVVNIKKLQANKKLTQILIVFYRADKLTNQGISQPNNIYPKQCSNINFKYLITNQTTISCPSCVIYRLQNRNDSCDYTTGRCKCQYKYMGYDCRIQGIRLFQANQLKEFQVISKKYFYYIPDSSQSTKIKLDFLTNSKQLVVLFSIQNTQIYPYVTISNIYNWDQNQTGSQIFTRNFQLQEHQILLITVTNFQNEQKQFGIDITTDESLTMLIIKIVLIIMGCVFGVLIFFVVICYCCFKNQVRRQKNMIVNKDLSADIFPTVKYSIFQKQILENKVKKNKLIFLMNSSTQQKQQQNKQQQNDNICAICLEPFQARSLIKYTYCNHVLDSKCLQSWMERQQNCPLCRQVFDYDNVVLWQDKIKKYIKMVIQQQRKKRVDKRKSKKSKKKAKKKKFQSAQQNIYQNRQIQYNQTLNHLSNKMQKQQQVIDEIPDIQNRIEQNKELKKQDDNSIKVFKTPKISQKAHSLIESRNSKYQIGEFQNTQFQNSNQQISQEIYVFYKGIWLYHQSRKQNQRTKKYQKALINNPDISTKKILQTFSDQTKRNNKQQYEINIQLQVDNNQKIDQYKNQDQVMKKLKKNQNNQLKQEQIMQFQSNFIPNLSSSIENSSRN